MVFSSYPKNFLNYSSFPYFVAKYLIPLGSVNPFWAGEGVLSQGEPGVMRGLYVVGGRFSGEYALGSHLGLSQFACHAESPY